MGKEKERRFIALGMPDTEGIAYDSIKQIYIECSKDANTLIIEDNEIDTPEDFRLLNKRVRLRCINNRYIEINSKSGEGIQREEYEFTVSNSRLKSIIEKDERKIEKNRYYFSRNTVLDEFLGRYRGICILEMEIVDDMHSSIPSWSGPEITGISELSNYSMYMSDSDVIWKHIRRIKDDNTDTQA